MRRQKGRGFRGQLRLDIKKLQRHKDKLEHRVQKMVQELVLTENLIKAMEIGLQPEPITPAAEAAQVAEGIERANTELQAELDEAPGIPPELLKKDEPNVQA